MYICIMRPQKILDKQLMVSLSQTFREKGYEGTSLSDISEATGLKKASLYYRFPNGKKEMAEGVLNHIDLWVNDTIVSVLTNENMTAKQRLTNGLVHIKDLYDSGKTTCIFRAFSLKTGLELFEKCINDGMNTWINAFTKLGIAFKLTEENAKEKALQTLIIIQGSLIVTKGLNDIKVFEKALKSIENQYLT